jgi:hypothetical protein
MKHKQKTKRIKQLKKQANQVERNVIDLNQVEENE